MRIANTVLGLFIALAVTTTGFAQFPTPSPEHKLLELEEGSWDAEVTMYMGPAGPYNPPHKSKGKEVNRMIGPFWVVTDFSGSFEGVEFTGHGQIGFDPEKKKFVGTWVDSFSPNVTHMVGTYDKEKKTMTYETTGLGMDGNPSKGRNVVVFGEDTRKLTMYVAAPDTKEMIKVMDIEYKRSK